MAGVNFFSIRAALRGALQGVPGLPLIRYEGQTGDPGVGEPWVREALRPVDSRIASFGGSGIVDGMVADEALYLVDVFYPISAGIKALDDMVDAVVRTFKPGTRPFISGTTYAWCQRAARGPMLPEADWLMVPVTIGVLVVRENS